MVLEELGLTYEPIYLDFSKKQHKAPEYTKFNPNGRIPALVDHQNGDFVIWESSAILLYLVDKYDTEKKLTVTDEKERYSMIQWLFFQASGQGCCKIRCILRSSARTKYSEPSILLGRQLYRGDMSWGPGGAPRVVDIQARH